MLEARNQQPEASSRKREARSEKREAIILLTIILLATSCQTALHIEKHPESYNPGNFSLRYSYINIPVEYDIRNLEKLVNKQFTGLIYADTSFDNNNKDDLMIKAWKMGDFKLNLVKNELFYQIPLRLWIKKRFEIGTFGISFSDTKEVTAEIVLKFKTHVTLNKNWTLSTVTFSDGYEWVTTPKLQLGPINVPIPFLADLIVKSNQSTVNKEIDNALHSALDLHQYIGTAWSDMQKPIRVSADYPLWAKITPVELSTIPLSGSATGIINQSIGIKATTELFYGREPEYTINSTLPDINIISKLDNSFKVNLPVDITFEHLNNLAKQQMKGYKITQGKYTITINDLEIYGNNDNLVVAVDVSGNVNGKLYLTGKPYYDKASSTLRLLDLDFDIKTKNVLVKSASWLFKHGLKETLQKKLEYPIGEQLQQTKKELITYLDQNRKLDMFTLSGSIQSLDLDGIIISKKSVKVLCVFEGKLNVRIEVE